MSPPEVDRLAPPPRGPAAVPGSHAGAAPASRVPGDGSEDADEADLRSLSEDIQALIEDGKTYLEAELVYQKSRAAFVADGAKAAFIYGAVAAVFGFLALIGLTVGLIIALTPWLTAWGASALVVVLLMVAAILALRQAAKRWNALMGAIDSGRESRP